MVTDVSPGSVVPSERGTYPCSENSGGGGIPFPLRFLAVRSAPCRRRGQAHGCKRLRLLRAKHAARQSLGRPLLVRTVEGGRHLAHESLHLVLDLLVRLQPDIEVEDHLVKSGGFHLLER